MAAADETRDPALDEGLDAFSGRLPIFPLPNVVLFPGVLQPLHVFEPRFRAMVADALAGERLIGMALLMPGWETDYEGAPPVYPVVCTGRMVKITKLPDGRYNIMLLGLRRARVERWVQESPYRVAEVTLLYDQPGSDEDVALHGGRLRRIVAALKSAGLLQGWDEALERLGPLTNVLAAAVQMSPERKQALLAELDVSHRAGQLVEILFETYQQAMLMKEAARFKTDTPELN